MLRVCVVYTVQYRQTTTGGSRGGRSYVRPDRAAISKTTQPLANGYRGTLLTPPPQSAAERLLSVAVSQRSRPDGRSYRDKHRVVAALRRRLTNGCSQLPPTAPLQDDRLPSQCSAAVCLSVHAGA